MQTTECKAGISWWEWQQGNRRNKTKYREKIFEIFEIVLKNSTGEKYVFQGFKNMEMQFAKCHIQHWFWRTSNGWGSRYYIKEPPRATLLYQSIDELLIVHCSWSEINTFSAVLNVLPENCSCGFHRSSCTKKKDSESTPSPTPPWLPPPPDQVSCQERQNSFSQNQTEIFPQMLRYQKHQQIL